jgi:8-oxo-dGTP diphosphatase
MKIANVCFLRKGDEILLAMKKRGFGVGKWNGVGGKVQEGETLEQAMIREAKEEIGVDLRETDLEKVAEIEFLFPEKDGWDMCVHVFFTRVWEGEPIESDEMQPKWFKISEIPLDQMWIDDKYWLMDAINGKRFKAVCSFKGGGEEVVKFDTVDVDSF